MLPAAPDLSVSVGPVALRNPVLAASGTFGFGLEYASLYDLSLLGGIVLKSVTLRPRAGNPPPRLWETAAGLLNSIGLENPGLDALCDEILPALEGADTVVVASVAGESPDEFAALAARLGPHPRVDALEINVSCPNQRGGGMAFGQQPDAAGALVRRLRSETDAPLWVKLTPNVTDVAAVAQAAEAAGADAVCLVNTFLGLAVDWRSRRPRIAGLRGRGGVSGPAVKPMALRMVRDVYEAVSVPVVGLGGLHSADDVLECMVAGAAAVQVGTAHFVDPRRGAELPGELARLLSEEGVGSARELVGTLAEAP